MPVASMPAMENAAFKAKSEFNSLGNEIRDVFSAKAKL